MKYARDHPIMRDLRHEGMNLMTERTPRSFIAQLARESCDFHRDIFSTPTWDSPERERDEPYISDSVVDDATESLDAVQFLTHAMIDDAADEICAILAAAYRSHTLIRDLPDASTLTHQGKVIPTHYLKPDLIASYGPDRCICDTIPFETDLISPCPHD
jgi:hypothetical protein